MRTGLVALGCFLATATLVAAQTPRGNGEAPSGAQPEGIKFSRVFAPADKIADWPRDGVPYLPVKTAEFERLLRAAQDASPGALIAAPRLDNAAYKAQVVGDDLVGTAQLDVAHPGATPALLMLSPCDLAMGSPCWAGSAAPVSLGLTADGKTALLVESAGRLQFDWSLRGRREADGSLHVRLALPPCPLQRLQLTLPAGCNATSDQGLAQVITQPDGTRQATLELGGHSTVNLRIESADPRSIEASLSLLRQTTTYDVTTHGVNVSAQLKVDVHQEPLKQLIVQLDPLLQPITARYGEALVPYSLTTDATTGRSRLVLDFSEQPIRGTNRIVQLGLLAPLPTDGHWRLPGIRPEGLFWQGGSATLVVQAPLSLSRLQLSGCRQVNAAPLPAPLAGESIELQHFTPQPDVEVEIAPRKERLQWAAGMSITLSGAEVKSQTVAEVRASQGNRFELEARVARPWMVDSVESIPAGGIEDWAIEDSGPQTRKLTVRLKKSVQSQRSVRLLLTGRRRSSPLGESLSVDHLQMVDFQDAQPTRRVLSVRTLGPYDMKISCTEEVTRLDPQRLDEADADLFREPPAEIFFVIDAASADWKVRLASRAPRFSGDVAVQAAVRDETLSESYTIRCTPESAGLDDLLVHISQARPQMLNWSLAGEPPGALTARPLSVAEQRAAGFGEDGETWAIAFRRPRTATFELRGSRSVPLDRELPIALASLAGASTQQGMLVVRTTGETPPLVSNRALTPAPAEAPPDGESTNIVGAYRFDPARDAQASVDAPIAVAPGGSTRELTAWAWRCRVDSRYTPDGGASHAATFQMETTGRPRVRLALPLQAEVRSLYIDEVRGTLARDHEGAWVVELPPQKRFPTIAVYYTTKDGPLGLVNWLSPTVPTIDVPVLSRQMTLWLPPGYLGGGATGQWSGSREQASWSQRLFGPLGRAAGEKVFDPFDGDDWGQLTGGEHQVKPAKAGAVLEWLGAALVGMARNPARLDWGQLLGQFATEFEKAPGDSLTLLVDDAALEPLGITSRTPLEASSLDAPAQRAAVLLAESQTVLVLGRGFVLITSASKASSNPEKWSPVTVGIYAWDDGRANVATDKYLSVEAWRNQPPPLGAPWSSTTAVADIAGASPGWTAYRIESTAGATPWLRVVHRESMIALGWTLFLAVAAGCLWLGSARRERLIAAAGVLGVFALLVPEAFSPPLTGALLGMVFALVWQWAWPKSAADPKCATKPAFAELASTKTLVTSALLLAALVVPGHADEPSEPIYKVFVPVDDQRQPVGDTSYLPKRLYDELYRRTTPGTERTASWIVEGATYRGTLTRDLPQIPLALAGFTVTYDLRTWGGRTRVRIPLADAGINLLPDAARLDGMAIEPAWELDGAALVIDVADPGRHRLELGMRLTQTTSGRLTGFDLSIPAVATSRLELSLPADAGEIEIPTARGAIAKDNAAGMLSAALGESDRLSVRWADGPARAGTPTLAEVNELMWLRLQPGSILLEAKFKYRVLSGRLEQIALSADPRLRLLPPGEGDVHLGESRIMPGDPQTIVYELDKPVSDEVTLEAKFLLTGTSSIGNLRLPRLEPLGVRSKGRAMAVSIDPALEWDETKDEGVLPLAVPEFLTAWGGGETKVAVAHRLPEGDVPWTLSTQPREPLLTARQLLSLDLRSGRAEVAAAITATTTDGFRYQYRLQTPPALQVESVTVHEEEAERPARWSHDEDGTLTVFLAEPASGEQKLLIKGWLPSAVRGLISLPSIRLEGAETTAQRILIFRRADALVKVRNVQGLEPDVAVDHESALAEVLQEGLLDRRAAGRVRLVGGWNGMGDAAAATVDVSSNAPLVSATQAITITRDADRWFADIECRFNVTAGMLDVLRFELPPDFVGPLDVMPSAAVEVVAVPGRDIRHLIVRPRSAIEGQYRLHIRGLLTAVHDRIHVPDVLPLRVEPLARYVVLPSEAESRQFAWDTQGLRAARLPPAMSAPASLAEPTVYRVEADRFAAELKAVERTANSPKVRLADLRVARQVDGAMHGTAAFDVEPAGATSCTLEMPAGYQIVSVTSAGLPVALESSPLDRMKVPLSTPQLPQRIEVVFQAVAVPGSNSGELRLAAPRLVGLPVEQTLWAVAEPASQHGSAVVGAEVISPARAELMRMQNTAALVKMAADLAGASEPAEEEARWYPRWARRMAVTRLAFQRERARNEGLSRAIGQGEPMPADTSAATTAERDELQAARQMGVALPTTTVNGAEEAGDVWAECLEPEAVTQAVQVQGPADSLSLRVAQAVGSDLPGRLLAALVIVPLTLMAVAVHRNGLPADFAWRWSHALVIVTGLAWWLWLWPSVVGLAITTAGVVSLAMPLGRWLPRATQR